MRILSFSLCVTLALISANSVTAQKTKQTSSGSGIVITEATSRRTLPGRREGEISTEYRFQMTWNSKTVPMSFYWKPNQKDWVLLKVARPERTPMFPGSPDYRLVERFVKPGEVHQGDKLILTSERHNHGSSIMPAAAKKMSANAIYYQTKANTWQIIPIKKLTNLPDIVLP